MRAVEIAARYGMVCSTDQLAVHEIERAQKLSMLSSSELTAGVLIICDHQKKRERICLLRFL